MSCGVDIFINNQQRGINGHIVKAEHLYQYQGITDDSHIDHITRITIEYRNLRPDIYVYEDSPEGFGESL